MFRTPDQTVDQKWKGAIERALGSWETVAEWADYISFLSRLQKAIRVKATPDSPMPLTSQVSEYLARCLEPSLPAGVHQTTLDVYNTVFTTLTREQLDASMNIWLPGILPVVSYAAFNVKPLVVQLIEKHILPSPALRELCRPLFAACLPSLDDESSECFDEILELLANLRTRLNDDILFWQTLFICVITSSESSLGFLTFCNRHLPSFKGPLDPDARVVISPEPGLLLRALCSGLNDPNVLVQRGFLDILVKQLPLDSPVFSSAVENDVKQVVYAACSTIGRKDMSLNRRLWSWLLGPEPDPSEPEQLSRVAFFEKYGQKQLTDVLLENINTEDTEKFARTCFVTHGLMDRWELASSVVPEVLVPVIKSAMKLEHDEQAIAAASELFDGIEAVLIWKSVLDLILAGDLVTSTFLVKRFNVQDDDMLAVHIPNILLVLSELLKDSEPGNNYEEITLTLLKFLQPANIDVLTETSSSTDIIDLVSGYYTKVLESEQSENDAEIEPPISKELFTFTLASNLMQYYAKIDGTLGSNYSSDRVHSDILLTFLQLFPSYDYRSDTLSAALVKSQVPDASICSLVSGTLTAHEKLQWIQKMADYCFQNLSSNGSRQVELIRDFWKAHEAYGGYAAPSALATSFMANQNDTLAIAKVFSSFWVHSVDRSDYGDVLTKPTFLFLDLLSSKDAEDKRIALYFLGSAIISTGKSDRLFKLILDSAKRNISDHVLFEYNLSILSQLIQTNDKALKQIFLEKYSSQTMDLFVEWLLLNEAPPDDGPYQVGLSLVLMIFDGDLSTAQAKTLLENTVVFIKRSEENGISQPLVSFVSEVLNRLDFDQKVTFGNEETVEFLIYRFIEASFKKINGQLDAATLSSLFDTFLATFNSSIPQVVSSLTATLIASLESIDAKLIDENLEGIKNNDIVIQILLCLEKLILTCFQSLYTADSPGRRDPRDSSPSPSVTSSAATSNLIGNVISGVFSVESPSDRSALQNGRVLLYEAMDQVMEKCANYWKLLENVRTQALHKSEYNTVLYVTGRLKSRVRKLTSMLYKYSPTDSIKLAVAYTENISAAVRFIHTFENTRYKQTVQLIINELESRYNSKEKNTQGYEYELEDHQLVSLFVDYITNLDDDIMEDVWVPLVNFLAEVNSKSSNYSPILLDMANLCEVVSTKLDKNSFGQRKKVRKDLSDLLQRLVNNSLSELSTPSLLGETSSKTAGVTINSIVPGLANIITETEKHTSILSKIMSVIIAPSLKSADSLSNVSVAVFDLLKLLVVHSQNVKVWRGPLTDIFFDPKLFTVGIDQLKLLLSTVDRWAQVEKERLSDFLARIASFGSNSVLFGWSGSQELTNTNLLRLAFFHLGTETLPLNYQKLINQLAIMWNNKASTAHVCILLRALILGKEPSQLATLYSFLSFRLQDLFANFAAATKTLGANDKELRDVTNLRALVEAARTLDFALTIDSDQLQIYEWLFINDSTDAIYPNEEPRSGDILDKLANEQALRRVDDGFSGSEKVHTHVTNNKRHPLLPTDAHIRDLHAFLNQASIAWYETAYSMTSVDVEYMRELVLKDLLK